MNNKNIWLVVGIIAVIIVIALLVDNNQVSKLGTIISTTQPAESVICVDPVCFQPKFLTCTPSELRMPFTDNTTLQVTVFGSEYSKCHYTIKLIGPSDTNLEGSASTLNCYMPFEQLSSNVFMHLLGSDKEPGQEHIKKEQDKLEAEYCFKH